MNFEKKMNFEKNQWWARTTTVRESPALIVKRSKHCAIQPLLQHHAISPVINDNFPQNVAL